MIGRTALVALLLLAPLSSHATPFWGAQESRPVETAPVDLKPGEYVWNAAAAPDGPIVVLVSLGEQRAYVYRNGVEIGVTTISTGKGGYETPTGVFVVLQKDKDHRSSKYNNAAMPYTQRLTWSGVALHAGGLPGYPSSHGCVHLPSRFSEELFAVSPMGMTVVVVDEKTAPAEVAHPPAFAPVDARTGAARVPERLRAEQDFRLEPEKSPHGPVSIVISAADRRALLLRNGVEIGRARIAIDDSQRPFGTHAYMLTSDYADVPHPSLPGQRQGKWITIPMPGHFDDAGRSMPFEAASAVTLPEGFSRAVYLLLGPGSTMLITDAPILTENTASGFTILSDGPPGGAPQ
ncbi:MAG TPA: L,D-transpeptidase [Steroidobacteraceae bacterium]|nr:L,D-transpeptidase [Steroidobacteraceae bacterium]